MRISDWSSDVCSSDLLLVYNGAPLALVAEDLKRTAGIDVQVAPTASDVAFRGALIVDPDRARTVADLAALSGTRAERQGEAWVPTRRDEHSPPSPPRRRAVLFAGPFPAGGRAAARRSVRRFRGPPAGRPYAPQP